MVRMIRGRFRECRGLLRGIFMSSGGVLGSVSFYSGKETPPLVPLSFQSFPRGAPSLPNTPPLLPPVSPRHFPPPRRCSSFFRSVPTHPHTLSCDVSPCFPLCACCATVQRCYRLPFRPFTHPRATDRHTPPHTLPLSSTSTSFVPIPPPFVRSVIPIVRVIFSAPQSRHSRLTRPASLP